MLTWLFEGLGLHAGGGQGSPTHQVPERERACLSQRGMGCIPELETYLVGNQAYMPAVTAEMVLTMFGGVSLPQQYSMQITIHMDGHSYTKRSYVCRPWTLSVSKDMVTRLWAYLS